MDWKWLFTSFDGRIGRKQFWIGIVVLIIVSIVVYFVAGSLIGVSMLGGITAMNADGSIDMDALQATMTRANWFSLIMLLIFLWPGAALWIKRRHDRGSSGIDVWIFYGLQLLSVLLGALGLTMTMTDMGNGVMFPTPNVVSMILGVVVGLLGLYLLIVGGFLKGTAGENAYGPDPLAGKD